MKKKMIDPNMPVGKLTRIKDTLPPPEELMRDDHAVKVTLRLSEKSVAFFKRYAQKYHTKYQKVIRKLVDTYADHFAT